VEVVRRQNPSFPLLLCPSIFPFLKSWSTALRVSPWFLLFEAASNTTFVVTIGFLLKNEKHLFIFFFKLMLKTQVNLSQFFYDPIFQTKDNAVCCPFILHSYQFFLYDSTTK